jgi:hypothetical protein
VPAYKPPEARQRTKAGCRIRLFHIETVSGARMSLAAASAEGKGSSQEGQEPRQSSTPTNWLALVVAIIPLVGLVLSLVGYGVALSAERAFGAPHGLLFGSAFDLLQLSVWGVGRFIGEFSALSSSPFFWGVVWKGLTIGFVCGVIAAAVLLLYWWTLRARRGMRWLAKLRRQRNGLKPGAPRTVALALTGMVVFTTLGVPAAAALLLFGFVGFATILALVPIAAMHLGQSHIDDYVISPERCSGTQIREVRLQPQVEVDPKGPKERVAQCIEVKQASGEALRGRVVFSTSHNVLLYLPATGEVLRVQTQGAAVRVVSEL